MPLDLLLLSMNIKSPLIRKAIGESKIEDTLELLLFSKCQGGRRREALNLHNEWLDTEIKMPKGAGSRFIGKESLLQSQWIFFSWKRHQYYFSSFLWEIFFIVVKSSSNRVADKKGHKKGFQKVDELVVVTLRPEILTSTWQARLLWLEQFHGKIS